jgi:HlyD family secretion protein
LEQARRAARRAQKLAGPGTISAEELELAELEETTRNKDLEAAVFAAHAADYNVQAAKAVLLAPGTDARAASEDVAVELHAPVSGHVLRIHEKSERVVAMGTPLIEIGNPSALEIVIDVLSTDAVKIKPGNRILIEGWGGEGNLEARVRLVEPSGFTKLSALGVEEKRVNVIADFSSPPGPLGDGYRLDARIVIWEAENVAKIPASALFRHDGDWSVFVVENGRAYRKPVRIGHRSAFEVEILEGLTEGESVITHPSDRVKDRVRVRDGG